MASEDNKRIAKNTLLLYVRMFFTMLVGFYTSRVVLNALGVVDYGIYNVVGGIVSTLSVLNGAMAGSTQRWITIALGKGNEAYLIKVFAVGMTAQVIIAGVVLLLIEFIGLWYLYAYAVIPADRMETAFWVFQISTFTMILNIINVPFHGAIMAHEKMGAFAFFSITDVVMKLVICFALFVTSFDKLLVYSLLLLLAFVINFICIQVYCHRKFIEARLHLAWDKVMYKEMWGLAFWTISGNLAYAGYTQGITLLINLFFGPAMNAAAGIAFQATNIINQFSANFQIALNPQITKNYAQARYQEMHQLMFRSSKFSYFLMLLFAIPLFYESHFLLQLWLGNVPDHTVLFMRLGLFIPMLMAVRNPLVTAAMANGNLKRYQFAVNGIMLLICPILYIVYKFWGIAEMSNVVLLAFLSLAIIVSAYMLKKMVYLNFQDFMSKVLLVIIKVTILSFIIPGILYFIVPEGWKRLFALTIISICYTSAMIYCIGLDSNERIFLQSFFKKIKK
ncbi:lipopolysaccharide biosynthesis protein [Bacteroides clarus]|uniref:lipopolysaccharide biosynthesis protein n=1 Tax=Bacteroides clarus TaxID=626929 RepID=UPI00351FF96C